MDIYSSGVEFAKAGYEICGFVPQGAFLWEYALFVMRRINTYLLQF